jgi:allantoinase
MPAGQLLVHLVVNVEHWPFDQPMPRALLPAPHGVGAVPDIPNFSWVEYGMRCGVPRIMELFAEFGVDASVSLNAAVLDVYPTIGSAIAEAGWEIIAHGHSQRGLAEADEADVISRSLELIDFSTGRRPNGWLGPGLKETLRTPQLLADAGITHVFDWTIDDLPAWMSMPKGELLAIPYSLELNDSVVYAVERHADGELERRVASTLETYVAELSREARILTVGLHPHLIGVPHRIGELRRIIEMLAAAPGARFVTGSQINDWYCAAHPAPAPPPEMIDGQ